MPVVPVQPRRTLVLLLVCAATTVAALTLAPSASATGTVTVGITGKGDVSGPGIACSESSTSDCSQHYFDKRECEFDPETGQTLCTSITPEVELVAGADRSGYAYLGWTGCDLVSGRTCGMSVEGDRAVTARFADVQPPSVTAPTPGSGVHRGSITLGASANDNSGTVARVEWRIRGVLVATDTTPPFAASFDTTDIPDGAAEVRATAFDGANNGAFSTASITVDNTAPTVSVTRGPAGQTFGPGTTQTWDFSARDATSGVTGIACSVVPTGAADSFGACSGASSHSVANRPGGSYVFKVRVTDAGGLATASPARTFVIDATPPETSIADGPADGSSSSQTAYTFAFSASEGGSTFACRVYSASVTPPPFVPCSGASGHAASGFAPGSYIFEVRSTDGVGNVDPSPAERSFTVTASPASSQATGGPSGAATPTLTPALTPAPPPPAVTSSSGGTTTNPVSSNPRSTSKCRKLKGRKRALCVKRAKALAKCAKVKKASKRRACVRKARKIRK